jgi:hypothetical protein
MRFMIFSQGHQRHRGERHARGGGHAAEKLMAEDFAPSEAIERFRKMGVGKKK